jgi:hypothetical protein
MPNIFDPLPVGKKCWRDKPARAPETEKLKPGFTRGPQGLIYNPLDDPAAKRHWDKGAQAEAEKAGGFPEPVLVRELPHEAKDMIGRTWVRIGLVWTQKPT